MGNGRKQSHTAPGQMAGFMFQVPRALHWLAAAPVHAKVGLETKDDVAVWLEDGREIREQDKSSIREDGWRYGNKSYALWNTLSIWTKAIKSGEVDVDKTRFFLVTNKSMPEECLVRLITEASDQSKALECCKQLREIGGTIESKVGPKAHDVLSCEEGLLCKLVQQIDFESFQAEIGTKEREKIASLLHLSEQEPHDLIIDNLSGWISRTTQELWNNGRPGWIRRKAFDNQLARVRYLQKRKRFRASPARDLLVSEEEKARHITKLFVKQLEIIGVGKEIAFQAITAFVQCGMERQKLAEGGMVTSQDWDDFHENLKEEWENISRLVQVRENRIPEELGKIIYFETMRHKESHVGVIETEPYLVKGSFDNLANELEVGWHPENRDRLKRFVRTGVENVKAN